MHIVLSVDADTMEYKVQTSTVTTNSNHSSHHGSGVSTPSSSAVSECSSGPAPYSRSGQHQPYAQAYQPQPQPQDLAQVLYHCPTLQVLSQPQSHQQYYYDPVTAQASIVPPTPSVTIGHNTKIAPSGFEVKVGFPAAPVVPEAKKFTTTRTSNLISMPPKDNTRRGSDSSSGSVGTASISTRGKNGSTTATNALSHLTVTEQFKAKREKQQKRDHAIIGDGGTPKKRGERTRADEGVIPISDHITMRTPFFIPVNTPVIVCSSRDGVWRSGFSWRDNTRRVIPSSTSQDKNEGPTFSRTADVALFDSKGCPCDLDAMTSRPCYIRIDPKAQGANLYWKQSNGSGGGDFSAVPVPTLNYLLNGH